MTDWLDRLDRFVTANDYNLLQDAGIISHIEAEAKALAEYEKYRQKPFDELTQVEKDFISSLKQFKTIQKTHRVRTGGF